MQRDKTGTACGTHSLHSSCCKLMEWFDEKLVCAKSRSIWFEKRIAYLCQLVRFHRRIHTLLFLYKHLIQQYSLYSSHIRGLDLFYCALQCFIPWHLDFVDTWVIGEFCILCICANSQYSLVHFRFHFHLKTRTLLAAAAAAAAITTTHVKPQGTPKTNYRCRIHLTTQSSPSFCKSITNVC